jgi:hypothetical protein
MSILDGIGKVLDRMAYTVSPKWGMGRYFFRAQYAAAKTTRLTGGWSPGDGSVNQVIGNSADKIRARDFPYFSRAVKILADYTVGPGIMFQSRIRGTDDKLDRTRITCPKGSILLNDFRQASGYPL